MKRPSIPGRYLLAAALSLAACERVPPDLTGPENGAVPRPAPSSNTPDASATTGAASRRYIVVYNDKSLQHAYGAGAAAASMTAELARSYPLTVERSYQHAFRGASAVLDAATAQQLAVDPRVASIEPDGEVVADAVQEEATWGLDRIDQPGLPLNGTFVYPTTGGAGVHVYVIDSGIFPHNDFAARMSNGADTYIPPSGGGGGGPQPDSPTSDCNGHGTHVAGTIAGTRWGVAKGVTLHPVRVLGCDGRGDTRGVIDGVDWVIANHVKPAVVNMSLHHNSVSPAFDAAMRTLDALGVVAVASAGNDSGDACAYSPGHLVSVITAGAIDRNDAPYSLGNRGACVKIWAPGVDITSAGIAGPDSSAVKTGTSMASPHVAGAAALYLARFPDAQPIEVQLALQLEASPHSVSIGFFCANDACCTRISNPCAFNQCSGSRPDGCGGRVACHADCSLTGLCSCAGGQCRSGFCSCRRGPCL